MVKRCIRCREIYVGKWVRCGKCRYSYALYSRKRRTIQILHRDTGRCIACHLVECQTCEHDKNDVYKNMLKILQPCYMSRIRKNILKEIKQGEYLEKLKNGKLVTLHKKKDVYKYIEKRTRRKKENTEQPELTPEEKYRQKQYHYDKLKSNGFKLHLY